MKNGMRLLERDRNNLISSYFFTKLHHNEKNVSITNLETTFRRWRWWIKTPKTYKSNCFPGTTMDFFFYFSLLYFFFLLFCFNSDTAKTYLLSPSIIFLFIC